MQIVRLRRPWLPALVLLAAVCALALAACGGGDSSSSTTETTSEPESPSETETTADKEGGSEGAEVDVGNGMKIPLSVEDMKIAFVSAGEQTPLGVSQRKNVEAVAAKYDIPVKSFDSQLDVNRQYSLYQNVIASGEYNVLITLPMGGQQDCEILTKTAPEKGIVVSDMTIPICNRENESPKGDGLWSPGTLNTVGINTNTEALGAWAEACAKESGGGEAILLNGSAGTPNNKAMTKAYEATDLDIVANYATAYLTSEAVEKVSAALLAHPGLKVIATQFPALTEGALQALKAAGKTPGEEIKLCNQTGGTENMLNAVEAGEVLVDQYVNDGWTAVAATQSVIDAAEGKTNPRVIVPGQDGEIVKSGTVLWPPWYTKKTADQYEPTGE